jgi:hypothetical protein
MAMIRGLAATNFGRAATEAVDDLQKHRQTETLRADRERERAEDRAFREREHAENRDWQVQLEQLKSRIALQTKRGEAGIDAEQKQAALERQIAVEGGTGLVEKFRRVVSGKGVRMPEGPGEGVDSTYEPEQFSAAEKGLVRRAQLGKDAEHIGNYGTTDRITGKFTPNELGTAEIEARKALGKQRESTAERLDRSAGIGADSPSKEVSDAIKTVEAQRKTLQSERTDLRLQRDSELRNAVGRSAKQQIMDDYAERMRKLDSRLADLDSQYDELRRKQSLPGREKGGTAGSTETAAEAPPVSLLKEGVRTKFKNGQVWTLRGGKPIRVQ